jgi:hypothetical protein
MSSYKNKIVYIALFLMIITISVSCDNVLFKTPHNRIATDNFFKNANDFKEAVIGAYAQLRGVYSRHYIFTEMRSDNTIHQYNSANRGHHPAWIIDEYTMTQSDQNLSPFWRAHYNGIQRCNTILIHINDIKFKNDSLKNHLIGQAEFLRAFYYYDLARLFGGVPLVLKQVTFPDQALATANSRADTSKIYAQIIKDAEDAVGKLPQSYTGNNKGKATVGAARTLLANVYLTKHNYSKAASELKKVMNLGYSLLPNYAEIFDPANKNNQEIIFAVNYVALANNKDVGNQFIYKFAPFNSGTQIVGDKARVPWGLNIPTRSMVNAYEPGDRRKGASIGYFVSPENKKYGIAIGDSIPYIKKYDHISSVTGVNSDNWPVYRYAQVLLMMAEAENELGKTNQAYPYINRVRNRAGLPNLQPGLTQSQFRKKVYHEERVELSFEDHRWFNLLRTGRAIKVMTKQGKAAKNLQPHIKEPVYVIKPFKLKYPIPQREININPNLKQNPGW